MPSFVIKSVAKTDDSLMHSMWNAAKNDVLPFTTPILADDHAAALVAFHSVYEKDATAYGILSRNEIESLIDTIQAGLPSGHSSGCIAIGVPSSVDLSSPKLILNALTRDDAKYFVTPEEDLKAAVELAHQSDPSAHYLFAASAVDLMMDLMLLKDFEAANVPDAIGV
jgi:hypothetical protein